MLPGVGYRENNVRVGEELLSYFGILHDTFCQVLFIAPSHKAWKGYIFRLQSSDSNGYAVWGILQIVAVSELFQAQAESRFCDIYLVSPCALCMVCGK